jgi:hydrogenase maturation protein HypF
VNGERIHIRGTVQGVGLRPAVWRIAHDLGLRGQVANDREGVVIDVWGAPDALHAFVVRIRDEAPALARIGGIERATTLAEPPPDFRIVASERLTAAGPGGIAADAAICPECRAEILDPASRRHRYPFTNCTNCGPRLSIVERVPYDRVNTTMAGFDVCVGCAAEYGDPANRRFHAQPIACPACGPQLALGDLSGDDALRGAIALLRSGEIVAIQGLGGYQLACDATNEAAVARLRAGKQRDRKPFALMARDLAMVRRHCRVDDAESALLQGAAAPIVLLDRIVDVAAGVAPGVRTLGFMLPATPLHVLLLEALPHPIVLTSGNLSDEPQAIERSDAHRRLAGITSHFLEHDRPIARRLDDSVARVVAGKPRLLRRARGYAPAAIALPEGFANAPATLAFGGEVKNTFCLLRSGAAIVSPHIGDLENALARADYTRSLSQMQAFHDFSPRVLACDLHPDYASTAMARATSRRVGIRLVESQHHHAHIAACMAENGLPLDASPVLGIALDGIGFGTDGTLWGGEFLLADYAGFERLASFKPIALPGGEAAIREPWRNTYAHIVSAFGWEAFSSRFGALEIHRFLADRPRAVLDGMIERSVNAPLASSCGRLFDAVAAACGIARDEALYEGQGAVELEALVDPDTQGAYPFDPREPRGMWEALLDDLRRRERLGAIAARFHEGVARGIVHTARSLAMTPGRVALSGGVFQNRVLFERVRKPLEQAGFEVLSHCDVPCNDGGLALGQAVIAAARVMRERH